MTVPHEVVVREIGPRYAQEIRPGGTRCAPTSR